MNVDNANPLNDGPDTWIERKETGPAEGRRNRDCREELEPRARSPRVASRTKESGQCCIAAAAVLALVGCLLAIRTPPAIALSPNIEEALEKSTYVYIASSRKDGSFGTPAEIWFMYHRGAVWVASPPTTWRVRRIRADRPKARIAIGKRDGASFTATGSIVTDEAVHEEMFRTFARKYPKGWPKYEQRFRSGLADGTRVLVRYQPID